MRGMPNPYYTLACFLVLWAMSASSKQLGHNGKIETLGVGIEYVWEAPMKNSASKILFLAHGCAHSALDFWPSNSECPDCVGLPAERQIVLKALENGYFVVAVSSAGRNTGGCWNPKIDTRRVLKVLGHLKKTRAGLRTVPIFALGVSSGGEMAAALVGRVHDLAGLCIQVMAPDLTFQIGRSHFPPSQWIFMEKDVRMAKMVNETVASLRQSGSMVDSILARQIAITKHFFSDRITEIAPSVSEAIYTALLDNAIISKTAGYLLADPRHSNWRSALEPLKALISSDTLIADQSAISEVLNTAYAFHEITAEYMDRTISFFDKAVKTYATGSHNFEHRA